MTRLLFAFFAVSMLFLSACQPDDDHTYVEISTDYGKMKVRLYNSTPKHKENFIKLATEGFYDSLLFHRVIDQFMIQGGDPNSKDAAPGQMLGQGGPGYMIDQEIGSPHFAGTLAAARNNNPQKRSSGSQFYIVQGRPVNDDYLDQLEQQKHIKYSPRQRSVYLEKGGAPFLDGDYTVFGEVVEGLDMVEKIAKVAKDNNNRPTEDIRMTVKMWEE